MENLHPEIESYLRLINSTCQSTFKKTQNKTPVLFVEGYSDCELYHYLLNQENLSNGITKYRLNIKKEFIFYEGKAKPASFYGNIYRKQIENLGEMMCYDYVIRCTDVYKKHYRDFQYLSAYGFVDQDFGHNLPETNMEITEMHDTETNLLYYAGPCILTVDISTQIEDLFIKVLGFTYQQGILEKSSFNDDSTIQLSLKRITHQYFKNNIDTIDILKFNFDDYLKSFQKGESIDSQIYSLYLPDFIKEYHQNVSSESIEKNDFQQIIHQWLNGQLSVNNEILLKRILAYSNGHFVLQLLLRYGKDFFEYAMPQVTNENTFVEHMRNYNDVRKNIFSIKPLSSYNKYRFINNEYTKL